MIRTGLAIGYASGLTLLLLCLIPVTKLKGSTYSLRMAIGTSGGCWLALSLLGQIFNQKSVNTEDISPPFNPQSGWIGLFSIVKEATKVRQTFKFLIAWFLLSDVSHSSKVANIRANESVQSFSTITSTAILYAKISIHMPPSSLIVIGM